ncbi:MAG: hypothetical protein IT462_16660 [Planctomycetes bacterium]|nr:hypothetical protein [Planctomycetota bacterium]
MMPKRETTQSTIRIYGNLGHVHDVAACLEAIEQTYSGALLFINLPASLERLLYRDPSPRFGREYYLNGWPPRFVDNYSDRRRPLYEHLLPKDKLVLHSAKFNSPGSWAFQGIRKVFEYFLDLIPRLVSSDNLRQATVDAHEHQKDAGYRNEHENERLALENERMRIENDILEVKAISDAMLLLERHGVPDEQRARLATSLLLRPAKDLRPFAQDGLLTKAEMDRDEEQTPRKHS